MFFDSMSSISQALVAAESEGEQAGFTSVLDQALGRSPSELAFLVAVVLGCMFVGRLLAIPGAAAIKRALNRAGKTSELATNFIARWVKRLGAVLGLIVGLETVGVATAPLIAGFSVFGVVIGFAFKDTLSNLAAGVLLMFYSPFDKGDVVDLAGHIGVVEDVTIAATTLLNAEGRIIIIPNASVWGSSIVNITKTPILRVQVDFGVAYQADLAEVESIAVELMRATEGVLLDEEGKEPMCVVTNWGASSVDHAARCWTKNEDFWTVKFELQRRLKEALDAKGIEIPFPQRVVRMLPDDSGSAA